jgi:hypothetical protein
MAERLIAFKKKISEEWLKKQNHDNENVFANSDSENESESDGPPMVNHLKKK